jgi:putative oxygen-independent coproporphyrinogen III oxidase
VTLTPLPLSLYVHIPWCVRKCPYCDFNSHELRGELASAEYVDALLVDLDADLAELPWLRGRRIETVFFGGGTPSLFPPERIAAILDGVAQRIALDPAAEITLETNPGTVEHAPFDGYRDAGVNRISFGVQSFDDDMLERLGRIHGADEARDAVKQAQDAGLSNINLDLMYALPEQSLAGALADVEHAIALAPAHVSHYQLTLEPNTRFAAQPPPLPDDDSAWAMQEACQALLASAGFVQYEISAYAREGRQCAHNLNYWRFGDYLGIGAGAHGKLTAPDGAVHRRWKQKHPRTFQLAAATRDRLGGDAAVAPDQLPFEFMLNVLRLNAGFALAHFERSTGLSRDAIAAPLAEARRRGWLAVADDAVVPTPLGARFLNDVIAEFLP